ncbi:MAG: aminotransferase class I/II-fold pyridoxal phosphate-dependent enzyme [Saprospiraceae bacterium]
MKYSVSNLINTPGILEDFVQGNLSCEERLEMEEAIRNSKVLRLIVDDLHYELSQNFSHQDMDDWIEKCQEQLLSNNPALNAAILEENCPPEVEEPEIALMMEPDPQGLHEEILSFMSDQYQLNKERLQEYFENPNGLSKIALRSFCRTLLPAGNAPSLDSFLAAGNKSAPDVQYVVLENAHLIVHDRNFSSTSFDSLDKLSVQLEEATTASLKENPSTFERYYNLNRRVQKLKNMGIIQLSTGRASISKNGVVEIEGREVHNFASCNYLGLESDYRIKSAAHAAIEDHGIQFYVGRSYISLNYYTELESLLNQIFESHTIVFSSTSLAHISCIPLLVGKKDTVILDHNTHASIHMATKLIKANGIHVDVIKHSKVEALEEKIIELKPKYDNIWYMADGVYSMFGDLAPYKELQRLSVQHKELRLYIDDSNGMSWIGNNGSGTAFQYPLLRDKMIVVSSLGKGFGAAGAVAVFQNEEDKKLVRNFGGSLLFSGPLPPPLLAGAVASAKIHLSYEIYYLQKKLQNTIAYFNRMAFGLRLPFVQNESSPTFFLCLGQPEIAFDLAKKLINAGFFTSLAVYPSVPKSRSGLRIALNINHEEETINNLLLALARELNIISKDKNFPLEKIYQQFEHNKCNLRVTHAF